MTYNIRHKLKANKNMHKDYINNLVNTFATHWIEYHNNAYGWNCDGCEIMKQDSRGVVSICLLEGSRHVNQEFAGNTAKEMIAFMRSFIVSKK